MSCMGCGSAMHYYCARVDDCGWSYDHGLNPGNPHAAVNETNRPDWLPGPFAGGCPIADGFVIDEAGWHTEALDDPEFAREFTRVSQQTPALDKAMDKHGARATLAELDGTRERAIAVTSGLSTERIEELGGLTD